MFTNAGNPETLLAPALLVLAVVASLFSRKIRWLRWWERPLARLARRKKIAIVISAAIPIALRAALLPWFPIPQPRSHDEFSFLLAADTFAHGRLVNPPHPFWVHFESEHILVRPVYASAFPIAQGVALAVGRIFFGHAWAGVWLSGGFMCGAICWMLQGWLPPRWALLGTILVILRVGISSYWMNSYWGGFLAAAGGALVLGAVARMMREPRWSQALIMGTGFAILANSRPFEGAVFGLAAMMPLVSPKRAALRRVIVPLALVLAVTGVGLAYYCWRVTGKPWVAPYVLYRNTMSMAPHFIFQKPTAELHYNNRALWEFYIHWEMNSYLTARNTPLLHLWNTLETYWRFYLGPLLTVPLLALPLAWRHRRTRPLLWMTAFFFLALVFEVWHNPHYAAPATGLAILLVMIGMRRLRCWRWRGRPIGLAVVRLLPPACALMLAIRIAAGPAPVSVTSEPSWRWPPQVGLPRAQIMKRLLDAGGMHVVFVRYSASHDPGEEWVYNGADIDAEPVVWARELDAASNARLMRYFTDRKVWLISPDADATDLVPYREAPPMLMPFVPLGAPGVEAIRSPEEVRRKVLEKAGAGSLTCDQWNYWFSAATGIAGPNATVDCYGGGDRGRSVPFEHWWSWLQRQPPR